MNLVRGTTGRMLGAVPPPEPLRLNDSVRVAGDFDARLTITNPTFGRGDIVLAPRLLCRAIGEDLRRGFVADTGIYSLSQRGDSLRFVVHAGGAYITWSDPRKLCRLQVVAPGATATICGTTVIVSVDASGRRGVFYLAEGAVRLGGLALRPGDMVTFGTGEPARVVPRDQVPPLVEPEHVNFHAQVVWNGPDVLPARTGGLGRVLRSPWTWVGLAAAGTGAWLALRPNDENFPASLTRIIVVRIPI